MTCTVSGRALNSTQSINQSGQGTTALSTMWLMKSFGLAYVRMLEDKDAWRLRIYGALENGRSVY